MKQAKRFKKKWLMLGVACAGAVIFHQPLLLFGCKIALKRALPETGGRVVSYEKLEWEEGAIVLSGLLVNEPGAEWIVDRIELKCAGDFFRARFAPVVTIVHPQILLKSSDTHTPPLGFLYRSRFFQPSWVVRNGVLQLPSSRFYFSMDPGGSEELIGSLRFSYDPNPLLKPMFSAEIGRGEQGLQIGFKLQESDLERLMPLAGLIRSDIKVEWERASGEVELEGVVSFGPSFEISELHLHGIAKDVALSSSKMGVILECNELQGSFSFPATGDQVFFWDKFSASLVLSRAECYLSAPLFEHPFGMKNLNGTLGFEPQKEPQLILNGTLVQEKRKVDFSLLGKGGVQEDSTFWSEIDFVLGSLRGDQMHTVFSLCSQEDASLALHAKVENARFDHLDFLRAFVGLPGECVEGVASGEAMLLYNNGWQSIAVENCLLDRMRWYSPAHEMTVFAELVQGSCALSPGQKWTLDDLHFEMKEGEYLGPDVCVKGLTIDFTLDKGVVQPSSLGGQWEGLKAIVTLLGPEADHFADLTICGDAHLAQELIPLSLQMAAKVNGGVIHLEGAGTVVDEPLNGSAIFALTPGTLFNSWSFKEGKLFAEKLTEKSYGRLTPLLCPDLKLTGTISCEASLFPSRTQLKILGEELFVHHPLAQLYIPELRDKPAQFFYDTASKQWRGEISFSESELYSQSSSIACKAIEGHMTFEGAQVKVHLNNLSFPVNTETWIKGGHCDISFDSKAQRLSAENVEGVWELISGKPLTVQLKRFSAELGEKCALDFALKIAEGKKEVAHFEGVATQAPSGWEIEVNPQTTHFGGTFLNIDRLTLGPSLNSSSFEMSPVLKCKDLQAQAELLLDTGFLPATFPADSLKEWKLDGTLQSKLSSRDVAKGFSFQAESKDLKVKGELLSSFSVRGQKIGEEWRIEHLTAGALALQCGLRLDAEGISCPKFEGVWEGLAMKGSGFLKIKEKRFSCALESIKGDLSVLKMDPKTPLLPKGTFVAGAALKGDFSSPAQGMKIEGEAKFFVDLQSPLLVFATSRKAVKFAYHKDQGLTCSNLDVELKHKMSRASLAEFQAEKLFHKGDVFSLEQMQYSLTPALFGHAIDAKILPAWFKELEWEGNVEGSGEFKMAKSSALFQGNLAPGRYGFDGKGLPFEQLQLRYENAIFSFRAKALLEEEPLWASFQVDLAKEPYGMLKLLDHPKAEGLKIHFKTQHSKAFIEKIQGSCYGLSCSLAKSAQRSVSHATVLSGEMQIDGNTISSLLPKNIREGMENLKFGSGYQWQGDLILWNEAKKGFAASGVLTGKNFEALGYRMHRLHANIEATLERICVSDVRIEDPSGSIGIKKIELNKTDAWDLHIPHVLVRQLRPSLMEKIDGERGELKPFMITNFTLSDIRGQLGKIDSLQGSGHLTFVNQFKKETSILDAPLEMLKKLGLDLGILTPVQGEIQMELHGDKLYLISLDNSFSEGDRSEFYLAPQKNLSFIGLDGKMVIDLKMRQDVVLKITEPFTLTIRGTLDKPRYGLQF